MGAVHQLIESKGKHGALEAGLDRREVEAAAAYLADDDNAIGFLYSGWCQAALPHRRLADDQPWIIEVERMKLMVEPGRRHGDGGDIRFVGVPFGSHARLIMIYLQTEALRTGSREVELGGSLRAWLGRIGVSVGGMTARSVRDQAERISRCRLTFTLPTAGRGIGLINQNIVDRAILIADEDDRQGRLSLETAKLSEGFFEQLRRHPVPLEEAAIRAVNNNSIALDIYAWLAYRLHALPQSRTVTWTALKPQFGAGFSRTDNFARKFVEGLKLALAVYPAARVEVERSGIVMHPSRPPVTPRQAALR
jgi:hypothetical protein